MSAAKKIDFVPFSRPSEEVAAEAESPKSGNISFTPFVEPRERSLPEEIGRYALMGANTAASTIAGLPNAIANAVPEDGAAFIPGLAPIPNPLLEVIRNAIGDESYEKYIEPLSKPLDVIKDTYPSSKSFREATERTTGDYIAPETPGEENFQEGVELFTNLALPGPKGLSSIKPLRAAVGTAAGLAAKEFAKEYGLGETAQEIAKNITALIPMIVEGKIRPTTGEREQIINAGRNAGLADAELAPLIQSEGKLQTLGPYAKPTKKLAKTLESTGEKLGDYLDSVRAQADQLPPLTAPQANKLNNELAGIINKLQNSHMLPGDKSAAITKINEMIQDINNFGTNPGKLIDTYRDINKIVNWNAFQGGKKDLAAVKNVIKETLSDVNPALGKEFESTNLLWQKYAKFQDAIGVKDLEKFIDLGETAALGAGIYTGNKNLLAKILGASGARRVLTKMLSDPKWQSIHRNLGTSIKANNQKALAVALDQFRKQYEKDYPKEAKEVDWKEFNLDASKNEKPLSTSTQSKHQ